MNVKDGIEYLLSHFTHPYFPRRIQTKKTVGQITVNGVEETMQFFEDSQCIDCRINAFSEKDIEEQSPTLIFVDLDNRKALPEVLSLFHKTIDGIPSVLDTGNGYAIVQPIQMKPMKNMTYHDKVIEAPAKKFLQFAERYLSNSKCDAGNHPSLKSCLVRVPGTFNSKCLAKTKDHKTSQVSIVSEWNGVRSNVQRLPFKKHVDRLEKIEQKMLQRRQMYYQSNTVPYIEKLLSVLKQPKYKIYDFRERMFSLIICPYLVNIKKQSFEEIEKITLQCFGNHLSKQKIRYKMNSVLQSGVLPYRLSRIKEEDTELYDVISRITNMGS